MHKTVTIKTIATELGLSVSAVSKALNNYPDINENTRQTVIKKAVEMGYSPNLLARSLVKNNSNSIGIVIRDTSTIYGELFKPLSRAALSRNLTIVMGDSNRNTNLEMRHIRAMIDSRVMGLIIAPVGHDTTEIDNAVAGRFPVVYLGSHVTDPDKSFVTVDNDYGTKLALDYLLRLGHRKIGFVSDIKTGSATNIKLNAYKREMSAKRIHPAVFIDDRDDGDLVLAAYRLADRILSYPEKLTAVFAVKDMLAAALMQALRDKGVSVPGEISVIGYDGAEISSFPMVNLTTIAQPKKEIAEKLIDLIVRLDEAGTEKRVEKYYAKPSLVIRTSCAEPDGSR